MGQIIANRAQEMQDTRIVFWMNIKVWFTMDKATKWHTYVITSWYIMGRVGPIYEKPKQVKNNLLQCRLPYFYLTTYWSLFNNILVLIFHLLLLIPILHHNFAVFKMTLVHSLFNIYWIYTPLLNQHLWPFCLCLSENVTTLGSGMKGILFFILN